MSKKLDRFAPLAPARAVNPTNRLRFVWGTRGLTLQQLDGVLGWGDVPIEGPSPDGTPQSEEQPKQAPLKLPRNGPQRPFTPKAAPTPDEPGEDL